MASPNTVTSQITVESLRAYSPQDAADLGILMPQLDPSFSGDPIPEARLRRIIDSPFHEQIVARRGGEVPRIVGALTMSQIMEPGIEYGYLGGVIVDPEVRGQGVGLRMLRAAEDWCRNQGLDTIEFVTEAHRKGAVSLYENGWTAERVTDGAGVTVGILYNKRLSPEGVE